MSDSVTLTVYAKHANPDFVEDDMIRFKYDVPHEQILSELPHYDIAVFPSIWQEPLGFVMAEYADSGLPILTSGRGGSKEIYNSNDLYVFDPENYNSFGLCVTGFTWRRYKKIIKCQSFEQGKAKSVKME